MLPNYRAKELAVFFAVAVLLLSVAIIAGRESRIVDEESVISKEIEKANSCFTDGDCAFAGSKCPFGCNIAVNRAEAGKIASLLDAYESNCIYQCIDSSPKCKEGRCIAQPAP